MKRLLDTYSYDTKHANYLYNENVLIHRILPPEVIQKIFMYLHDEDAPTAQKVCLNWKLKIRCIASTDILNLRNSVNFLQHNLSIVYTDERSTFNSLNDSVSSLLALIDSDKKELVFKKFISLMNMTKRNVFNFLMTQYQQKLDEVRTKLESTQLEHVIDLVHAYKNIEIMDKSPDTDEKSMMRKNICMDLVKALAKTTLVATAPRLVRSVTLKTVQKYGITRNDIISALESLMWEGQLDKRNALITAIAKELALYGEIKTAISFVAHMNDESNRDFTYKYLSSLMTAKGQPEEALQFANEITNYELRVSTCSTIIASTQINY